MSQYYFETPNGKRYPLVNLEIKIDYDKLSRSRELAEETYKELSQRVSGSFDIRLSDDVFQCFFGLLTRRGLSRCYKSRRQARLSRYPKRGK